MRRGRPGTLSVKDRAARFMTALSQTSRWLIWLLRLPQQIGRRRCTPRAPVGQITSKRPAACVKKILHSGSAQMNPQRARNCFNDSPIYILSLVRRLERRGYGICKCIFFSLSLHGNDFTSVYEWTVNSTCRHSFPKTVHKKKKKLTI